MRDYIKQKEIEEIFAVNGFSKSEYVVGTGRTFSKKGNRIRFEFAARNRQQILEKTAIYAVKYFAEQDFYILWKIRQKTSKEREVYRTCLSVDVDDANKSYEANKKVIKGVEFSWQLQEDVVVVDFENLEQIIEKISQKEGNIK